MLEVNGISKSFKIDNERENVVLNNINFSLPDKGFYFVIGKSGSGKSTLLNILMGLMKPDEGEVLYKNKDITKLNLEELSNFLKDDIGIIFQSYNLFEDLTVKENLAITRSIKGIESLEKESTLLYRYGLSDKLEQKVSILSGGEKQRLALVRSLLCSPKILFCDEPTGALDSYNSTLLMDELSILSREILVVCVSHNLELFKVYNDGYILLEDGNIKEKCLDKKISSIKKESEDLEKEVKGDKKYTNIISRKNIKKNTKFNVINSISAGFSILIMVISLFFNSGIKNAKTTFLNSYGDFNVFRVSKVKEEEIEDSLINLVKSEKPTYSEVQTLVYDIKDCLIFDDYSYFFSGEKKIRVDGKSYENFTLKPYFIKTHEAKDIIVNENFALKYKEVFNKKLNVGDEISLEINQKYVYYNETKQENIDENFNVELTFNVKEIRKEFSYLNSATLYYSPIYFEAILNSETARKTTEIENKEVSFLDLLNNASSSDQITNYSYDVITLNEESYTKINELIDKKSSGNLEITNDSKIVVDSFITLSDSVFLGVNIFIFIAVITSLFVSGFLSYSSSLRNRKESAILSILGAKPKDIIKIYIKEEMSYTLIGLILGVILAILLSSILNHYLSSFFITSTLININYLTLMVIFILLLILNYSVDFLTLKFQKSKKVYEELKEAWR